MKEEMLDEIRGWISEGCGGRELSGRYTRKIDSLLQGIFESSDGGSADLLLIATGGYGREELSPFSDIDIMFLAPDRADTAIAEGILYKLWDTGLDISHSFRTTEECLDEARKDLKTRTCLLEARYLAGSRQLFSVFRKRVYPEIAYRRQKDFVREKLQEMEKRHHSAGESVFLLEPHIKEGEGGLRDLHTAYWLSRVALRVESVAGFFGLLSQYDRKRFLSAYDFLLKTRFSLHVESGRRNDLLSFEFHRSVAGRLGFRDSAKFNAAERMLRYYHLKSKIIRDTSRKLVVACSRPYVSGYRDMNIKKITEDFSISGGNLISRKENLFTAKPGKILEGFYLYSKTGKKFSNTMKEHIRANLLRISRKTRSASEAVHHFLEIFKSSRVYDTLRDMHETGVLGRFVPEFGALRLLVVHEPYHLYTVDEHTLMAIRNLEALRTTKYKSLEDLHDIFKGMEHLDTLFMAILFHDIGKAAGRHHEEEGYKRLKNIMERSNLDVRKRVRIEFLVKNHILMSRTALTREATDPDVIAGFADAVGDPENLEALYLVTYADMSAVNPGFWTTWKAYLLRELYLQTMNYLKGIRGDRNNYIRCLKEFSPKVSLRALTDFIGEMPERYILSTPVKKVAEDYGLVREARQTGFDMRIDSSADGVAEISISAEDSPGLFSRIVGFLSSKGLNIVNGRIFTGKKGMVIDKISVSNWKEVWWEGLGEDIRQGLRGIIVEGMPVAIVRRERRPESPFDVFLELDNEASEEYSMLEIFSPDRLGLLYDISSIMHSMGVNIVAARINTEAGLAQDIFYVRSKNDKIDYVTAQELMAELWTILRG